MDRNVRDRVPTIAVRGKIKTTIIRYPLFLKDLRVLTYSSVAIPGYSIIQSNSPNSKMGLLLES
jgi:hypothetical protein